MAQRCKERTTTANRRSALAAEVAGSFARRVLAGVFAEHTFRPCQVFSLYHCYYSRIGSKRDLYGVNQRRSSATKTRHPRRSHQGVQRLRREVERQAQDSVVAGLRDIDFPVVVVGQTPVFEWAFEIEPTCRGMAKPREWGIGDD